MKDDHTLQFTSAGHFSSRVSEGPTNDETEFTSDGLIVIEELEVDYTLHVPPDAEENFISMKIGLNIWERLLVGIHHCRLRLTLI